MSENQNNDGSNEIVAHEGPPKPFHQPQVEVRRGGAGPEVTPQPIAQVTNGDEIMRTARRETGSPIYSGSITGDDIVTVRGVPMRIKQAVSMGFLRDEGNGNYSAVKGADPIGKARDEAARQAAAVEESKVADLPFADDATMAVLTDWSGACGRAGIPFNSIISDMITAPDRLPKAIEQLAYHHNVPLSVAKAEGQQMIQGVAAAVAEWLEERGVKDTEGFWNWARKDARGFSTRLGAMLVARDSGPMRELAQRFLRETGHGLTEKDLHTPVKVKLQGRVIETSRAYAVKNGLRIL